MSENVAGILILTALGLTILGSLYMIRLERKNPRLAVAINLVAWYSGWGLLVALLLMTVALWIMGEGVTGVWCLAAVGFLGVILFVAAWDSKARQEGRSA